MPTDETRSGSARLEFHGGLVGALLPLALFALGIVFVTISGMITIRAYFGPLVLVIGMVILLAKDRTAACEAMLSGVANRTLAVMIMAFLGAGVLGQILVTAGVIKAVVWLGYMAGLQGTAFILLTFLIAALVATATGTATGTCVTCVPILYPGASFWVPTRLCCWGPSTAAPVSVTIWLPFRTRLSPRPSPREHRSGRS